MAPSTDTRGGGQFSLWCLAEAAEVLSSLYNPNGGSVLVICYHLLLVYPSVVIFFPEREVVFIILAVYKKNTCSS